MKMSITVEEVEYTKYTGGGDIHTWITQACVAANLQPTDAWLEGYKTLCSRESSDRPNAINAWDKNAHGKNVADGHPLNCSRGIAQCIPSTFAAYHVDGTSKSIYDPVANIAASMRYVLQRYHVSGDGSDLARKVHQADPTHPPVGY
jgi:SLT domain-containing protein